ncbi:hypothetical protein AB0D12_17410 [Streptomyces sp. NPDC048479]|uniref:hypothetical protein n=1 Tax=Streptomyces sp. NPDC048479 TaxID=3154725 RepID=UPI00343E5B1B
MSSNSANQHACNHPGRDLTIVALSATLAALSAVIIVMSVHGAPLDVLKAGGGAFSAVAGVGMVVLQYLKRSN